MSLTVEAVTYQSNPHVIKKSNNSTRQARIKASIQRSPSNPYPIKRPFPDEEFLPYLLNPEIAVYGHSLIGDLVLKGLTSDLVVGGKLRVKRSSIFYSLITGKSANFNSLTVGGKSVSGGPPSLIGAIDNDDIADDAAIAYSKLNLVNSILNSDINSSAAIAYSKLNLAGAILNSDIAAGAGISYSKLDLAGSIINNDISPSAAIAYSKLNLANSIVSGDIVNGTIATTDLADGAVTSAKLSTEAKTHSLSVFIPDPGGAGADFLNYVVFKAPVALTLTKLQVVPIEDYAGVTAGANMATIRVKKNNDGVIVNFMITVNLSKGTINNFGTLNPALKILAADDDVTIDLVANGTANFPNQSLQIDYTTNN